VPPEVSVVVPAHNRPAGLARVLAALAAQTLAPERFEVVVVDDGSEPPLSAPGARVVRHERARGPAAARNAGWRAASAPLVAFVDDDCEPVPGWLEALLAAAGGDAHVVVQGPVGPPPGQRDEVTPLSHTIEVGGPSRLFVSANIAYARPLLERTGGFDETFTRACGEDVELGARVLATGAELRWAPGAVVHHEVRPLGLAGTLRQTLKWTDSVRAVSMHPELRDLLTARVFWRPSHALLLLALAAAVTRRPLVALAGALPYVRHRRGRWLGVHLAVDSVEIATAVAGSVRHRTLML
jgi:glycosyltransferase involved in cell wall biosynthesis